MLGAFVALNLCAPSAGSTVEDTIYTFYKNFLIQTGDSEFHANCVVNVMKHTGVTSDVTDIGNVVMHPHKLARKLEDKSKFADALCSPPVFIITIVVLLGFIFGICCVCMKQCCTSRKPMIIQMASSNSKVNIPYVQMDVA